MCPNFVPVGFACAFLSKTPQFSCHCQIIINTSMTSSCIRQRTKNPRSAPESVLTLRSDHLQFTVLVMIYKDEFECKISQNVKVDAYESGGA